MRNKTIIGQTVEQYLDAYPGYPSKTIAQILVEKEPKLFYNVEQARSSVRGARGNQGEKRRNSYAGKSRFRESGAVTDFFDLLPRAIDPGREGEWKVFKLAFKKALVLCDLHFPNHDRQALALAMEHGKKIGVDCIILNGDICSCDALSEFCHDPREWDVQEELEMTKRFMEVLREGFPKARIVFKPGNHEERVEWYVWRHSPGMAKVRDSDGKAIVKMEFLLDLKEYGIECVDSRSPILCGDHLYCFHGHEWNRPIDKAVNSARGLWRLAKVNAFCGHVHRTSNNSETAVDKTISTWSVGGLCNLHPKWLPLNDWNLGFAVVELDKKAWRFENKKIINGSVV